MHVENELLASHFDEAQILSSADVQRVFIMLWSDLFLLWLNGCYCADINAIVTNCFVQVKLWLIWLSIMAGIDFAL